MRAPSLQNCAYFRRALNTYTISILRQENAMILVTGASGTVGKALLNEVARSGARHKAMYRSAEEAAKAPAGTATVVADFSKKETLSSALRGVESVYLVCSPIPDLVQLETNMIDAGNAAGV